MIVPQLSGACHCGAIRFVVDAPREWLTVCNCSVCRRYRGLWLHSTRAFTRLDYDPGKVIRYVWNDRSLAFVSCATCGCTTHWEAEGAVEPSSRVCVNAAMADPNVVSQFRIRHFDGAETFAYLD